MFVIIVACLINLQSYAQIIDCEPVDTVTSDVGKIFYIDDIHNVIFMKRIENKQDTYSIYEDGVIIEEGYIINDIPNRVISLYKNNELLGCINLTIE